VNVKGMGLCGLKNTDEKWEVNLKGMSFVMEGLKLLLRESNMGERCNMDVGENKWSMVCKGWGMEM
jgi:hypothetical protein